MGRFGIGGKRNTSRFLPSSVVQYVLHIVRACSAGNGGNETKNGRID